MSTCRIYLMFDALLSNLEADLRAAFGTCITGLVATARARLEGAHADVTKERAKGFAELAAERAKALAEVDARRADLGREVTAMHTHREAQEGRVELNIGGYRFETSVQTLRRVPHTFFDAYFSGRYAQDVCNDGSIFVDRDGEHFGHVLEYMRDGVVSVAEAGAQQSVPLLRALKREFGFYCIELTVEALAEPEHLGSAFVFGGIDEIRDRTLSSMERYDAASGKWSLAAAMGTGRLSFGACSVARNLYAIGGFDGAMNALASVEKYSISSDTWTAVAPLPENRAYCAAVSIGSAIYVLGGDTGENQTPTASVLKFDCVEGTWSIVAPMPGIRSDCAACVVGTDIYVFGGEDGEEKAQASIFKYDTGAKTWSVLAPVPFAEFGLCVSVSVIDGLIYIIRETNSIFDFFRFDPVTGGWTRLARTACDCSGTVVLFALCGCLYAAGDFASPHVMERYDIATDTWSAVANMLERRDSFGAVAIGSNENMKERNLFDSLIAKAIREI
jgi:hypothetical protein